jgi:hypothetical protein
MTPRFPVEDTFLDFSGSERHFEYRVYKTSVGYSINAREKTGGGYEFESFSATNPFDVLGELRGKIKKRLSTRYLHHADDHLQLSHDEAKGHISSGGVMIDGRFVSFDQLAEIMQAYEGFMFHLRICDLSNE